MRRKSALWDKTFLLTLVTLMVPMILQNLLTLGTQMMDSIMLGQLGQNELSASSLEPAFFHFQPADFRHGIRFQRFKRPVLGQAGYPLDQDHHLDLFKGCLYRQHPAGGGGHALPPGRDGRLHQ